MRIEINIVVILLAIVPVGIAQIIPSTRITDWTSPGNAMPFSPQQSVRLTEFGADTSGLIASDFALQQAIQALNGPGEIFVSKGTYLFEQTIDLPDSIILQGETDPMSYAPLALLKLSPGSTNHGITITGSEENTNYTITYPLMQGQQTLYVSQPQLFAQGDFIRLVAFDDSLLVNDTWAYHTTGQILQIIQVDGDSLLLNKPLRRSYTGNALPVICKLIPRKHVHLRCLKIERMHTTTFQSSNIYLNTAADCSISGIESKYCNYAHIDVTNSTRVTIENSFFNNAFSHGSGGKGYGVMLQSTSGDCFIHQNNFEHLRHSMILQSGANGNVLAYNYSTDPFWTGTALPANAAGDMVLHGNYVYLNLFEGNVVQNIVIDNSHGINGPFNTFYRNRAELYGIFMNTSPASDGQNFVGNQVVNTSSLFLGLYFLQGNDHFEYGNIIKGTVLPVGTTEPNDTTMFDYDFGTFYEHISAIPPLRLENWQAQTSLIEAQYRYFVSEMKSTCRDIEYMPTSIGSLNVGLVQRIKVSPNPFTDAVYVMAHASQMGVRVRVFNIMGTLVYAGVLNDERYMINTMGWTPGIYFVSLGGRDECILRLLKH